MDPVTCHLSSVISIDFFNFAFGFVFSRRRARGSRKISVPVRCDGRGHIHMNYYYLHRYFTDCKKYLYSNVLHIEMVLAPLSTPQYLSSSNCFSRTDYLTCLMIIFIIS